jgi:hypothetical protein
MSGNRRKGSGQELHNHHMPAELGCRHATQSDARRSRTSWSTWLGDDTASDELKASLWPCPAEVLTMWPVDRVKLGNVRNKTRDLADPEPV